jgi:hypothetical protein
MIAMAEYNVPAHTLEVSPYRGGVQIVVPVPGGMDATLNFTREAWGELAARVETALSP